MSDKWDAVIVGSGISGLTCGAFLAKKGMRVKILEKHYRIGGYAHSFNRGLYRFESGIHSVPLDKNGYVAILLKELGIQDKITTISHDCMYTTRIGENYWRMPAKFNQIQESLFSYFPHERHNIQALFADMDHLYKVIVGPLLSLGEKGNESNPSLLTKYQEHTYQTYIESYISDPKLRQLFFFTMALCRFNTRVQFYNILFLALLCTCNRRLSLSQRWFRNPCTCNCIGYN